MLLHSVNRLTTRKSLEPTGALKTTDPLDSDPLDAVAPGSTTACTELPLVDWSRSQWSGKPAGRSPGIGAP